MFCACSLFITRHWSRLAYLGRIRGFKGKAKDCLISQSKLSLLLCCHGNKPFPANMAYRCDHLFSFAFSEATYTSEKNKWKIYFLKVKGTHIGEKTVTFFWVESNSSTKGLVTIGRSLLAHRWALKPGGAQSSFLTLSTFQRGSMETGQFTSPY